MLLLCGGYRAGEPVSNRPGPAERLRSLGGAVGNWTLRPSMAYQTWTRGTPLMHRATLALSPGRVPHRRRRGAPPATLVSFLLVLLLATTTPFGAGQGVHADQLLHWIFPHVHIVNGHAVLHESPGTDQAYEGFVYPATRTSGPALGAGAGANAESGLGIGPTLPANALVLPMMIARRLPPLDSRPMPGPVQAPPDPPPTSAA